LRRVPWTLALCLSTACAFGLGLGISHHFASRSGGATGRQSALAEVRLELDRHYYRPLNERVLGLPTVPLIVAALQDQYTAYLDPGQYSLLRRQTASSYPGIGVTVLPGRGGLVVAQAAPGPARRAGLRPGDLIVTANNESLAPLAFEAAVARILGREGTVVRLRVIRGQRELDFRVVRRRIAISSVTSAMVIDGSRHIGYIRLAAFRTGSADAVRRAVLKLQRGGATGFVLDLRANPGGLLDQAVDVSAVFLARGVVATIDGAHVRKRAFTVSGGPATQRPLVVLVDRFSASSAEVTAAALRDNDRALIVGDRTFGKTLVQSIEPLSNGAALKLTTARYLTPSGRDISRRGIEPDVVARDDPATHVDEALATALRVLPA
jgi:carboxyl-terminal processing protease